MGGRLLGLGSVNGVVTGAALVLTSGLTGHAATDARASYADGVPGIGDPDEIDVIAEDVDGNALLSIVQTGTWPAQGSARGPLKRKLNTYLRYAREGQMVSTYPSLEGRPIVIALMYDEPPPQAVLDYWHNRGLTVARDGITLVTRALDETVWRA